MNRSFTAHCVLLCLCFSGCDPYFFRADTRLLADGSIERAISQPLATVPDAALQSEVGWQELYQTRPVGSIQIAEFPVKSLVKMLGGERREKEVSNNKLTNFVAWGQFAGVAALPEHFKLDVIDGFKTIRMTRSLERVEFGFVTEWHWKEVLEDTFNWTEHRIARDEICRDFCTIAMAAARRAWGKSYDLNDLENWLNTELKATFHESCDLLIDIGLKKELKLVQQNQVKFYRILQQHGLDLFEPTGTLITDPKLLQKKIDEFVLVTIQKLVKGQAGKPLMKSLVSDLQKTIVIENGNEWKTRLEKSLEHILVAQYGGTDKFEESCARQLIRLFGSCLPVSFAFRSTDLDYRMEFPGYITKTTGELLADNQVRWRFSVPDAFPLGYSMDATSISVHNEAVRKHLPAGTLQTRQQVNRYLELVRRDKGLALALNQFAVKDDASQYDLWIKNSLESNSRDLVQLAKDVQMLLGR
jgi:hypothetical protein